MGSGIDMLQSIEFSYIFFIINSLSGLSTSVMVYGTSNVIVSSQVLAPECRKISRQLEWILLRLGNIPFRVVATSWRINAFIKSIIGML